MSVTKDFVVKEGLQVQGTTQSALTSSGALLVAGGAGIGGNINIGGSIKRTGAITGGTFATGAQLSLGDGTFTDTLTSGRVTWGVTNYFGSSVLDTVSLNATYTNATSIYIKGAPTAGSNLTIETAWALYATSGSFYIGELSGSTSSANNQALQVAGGISFGNGLYGSGGGSLFGYYELNSSEILTRATSNQGLINFPDGIEVSTSTNSFSTTTGAVIINKGGGLGVGGNVYVGGYLAVLTTATILGTENAVSTSTGALRLAGGLGIAQDLWARNGFFVSGAANTATIAGNSLQVGNNGGLGVSGSARIEGQVYITDTTASSQLGRGALVVRGGASIEGILNVASIHVNDATLATTPSNASLVVDGGLGVAGNVIIGNTDSSTGTTATNALVVEGGTYIKRDLTVKGNTIIEGDLLLLGTGTQVTINSTNTYIVDPVIELGGGVGGAMLTIPDVHDKGILIHHQNSITTATDYRAFMGLENTTERFIFKQDILPNIDGSDPWGDYYNSGTWSTLEAGSIILRDTTEAVDENTGALILDGGIGVAGKTVFANTTTFTSNKFNVLGIANNAVQVPYGGIGTNYLHVATEGWINGAQILTTGTVNAGIGGAFTNTFQFLNITQSNSTDSGAVTIAGGLGVAGNVYIGGNQVLYGTLNITNDTQSDNTTSGALEVVGGVGIGKNLNVGGLVTVTDATDSTATNNGSLVTAGGAGIAKSLTVGGNLSVANTVTTVDLRVTGITDSTSKTTGAATVTGGLGVAETIYASRVVSGTAYINSGTTATSTATGDLVVVGGVGVGQDAYIGGNVRILSTVTSDNVGIGALVVSGGAGIGIDLTVGGSITRTGTVTKNAINSSGAGLILSTATFIDAGSVGSLNNVVAINSVGRPTITATQNPTWADAATFYIDNAPAFTNGDATNKWSLFVANGNVKINTTSTNNQNTTTGALVVVGGVGVAGNITSGAQVKGLTVRVDDNLISSPKITGKTDSTAVTIDSYGAAIFTTAKYLVQIVDLGTPNKFHVVELVVTYDGTGGALGTYISQYGLITNTGELGTFDVTYGGGTLSVVFTPNYTPVSMSLRAIRLAIIT
jgi:hypothetical protein